MVTQEDTWSGFPRAGWTGVPTTKNKSAGSISPSGIPANLVRPAAAATARELEASLFDEIRQLAVGGGTTDAGEIRVLACRHASLEAPGPRVGIRFRTLRWRSLRSTAWNRSQKRALARTRDTDDSAVS